MSAPIQCRRRARHKPFRQAHTEPRRDHASNVRPPPAHDTVALYFGTFANQVVHVGFTSSFRRVSRLENEAVLDRMATHLKARPTIPDRRRESVEHPFGTIKQWVNQGTFLMKGLDTAPAYNLRRAINILGAGALMAASGGEGRRDVGQTEQEAGAQRCNGRIPAPGGSSGEPSFAQYTSLIAHVLRPSFFKVYTVSQESLSQSSILYV